MSWSQKHIDKNLEIVKKILTRLMLNLLETKNSYLIDGAVLRKSQSESGVNLLPNDKY